MPRIIIKTGLVDRDGQEEDLMEFMCDAPGCPNVATHVIGRAAGLGLFHAVCQGHYDAKKP